MVLLKCSHNLLNFYIGKQESNIHHVFKVMADRTLYDKHIVLLLIVLLITFDINSEDVPKCDG